jgi:DNA-binding GntR family transcriptional regulator
MPVPLASASADLPRTPAFEPLKPQTLVDRVIEAVIASAARGAILPGDRIVESDVARGLGVSRVPVREALRLLESQGIVISEPYKGIRLRPVTNAWVHDLVDARAALETRAAHRAIDAGLNTGAAIAPMRMAVAEMEIMAARGDAYGIAATDTAFHRALCGLGGNSVILDLWEALARQVTIVFGLASLGKPMPEIVAEHRDLLAVFEAGDPGAVAAILDEHIRIMNHAVDYEAVVAARRRALASARGVAETEPA